MIDLHPQQTIPALIEAREYGSTLRTLAELNHPVIYWLLPKWKPNAVLSDEPPALILTATQIEMLRLYIMYHHARQWLRALRLLLLGGAAVAVAVGILGLSATTSRYGGFSLELAGGVLLIGILMLRRAVQKFNKMSSANGGLW